MPTVIIVSVVISLIVISALAVAYFLYLRPLLNDSALLHGGYGEVYRRGRFCAAFNDSAAVMAVPNKIWRTLKYISYTEIKGARLYFDSSKERGRVKDFPGKGKYQAEMYDCMPKDTDARVYLCIYLAGGRRYIIKKKFTVRGEPVYQDEVYGYLRQIAEKINRIVSPAKTKREKFDTLRQNISGAFRAETERIIRLAGTLPKEPAKKEETTPPAANTAINLDIKAAAPKNTAAKKDVTVRINANYASEEELAALPGINMLTAKSLVAFREKNGYFKDFGEFSAAAGLSEFAAGLVEKRVSFGTGGQKAQSDKTVGPEKGTEGSGKDGGAAAESGSVPKKPMGRKIDI